MEEVRVRCGAKKEGERVVEVDSEGRRVGRVVVMRVVRGVWRGEVGGGRSQREEPGILIFFLFFVFFFFFFSWAGVKGVKGVGIWLVMGVVKGKGVVGEGMGMVGCDCPSL